MNGLSRVLHRINELQTRFQTNMPQKNDSFKQILKSAETKQNTQNDKSMASSTDIIKMLNITAKKYGIDPKLVTAIAKAESDFDQGAISSAGAVGVMQLMPETAQTLGVQNIYDVHQNIDGGVRYLKEMLSTFNGDAVKAIAAYNAGPQAVKEYQGIPPYSETQQYVAKVLAYTDR